MQNKVSYLQVQYLLFSKLKTSILYIRKFYSWSFTKSL